MDRHRKKIKVVYFFPIFRYASMARWVENFAYNHNKEEFMPVFMSGKVEKSFKDEIGKDVYVSELNRFIFPFLFFKLVGYFIKEKPDIFVSGFPQINTLVMIAKVFSFSKSKIVLVEHTTYSFFPIIARSTIRRFVAKFILPIFMKIFYPLSDQIVCVSMGVADDLKKFIKHKREIEVIYNPIVNNRIYEMANEQVDEEWFLYKKLPVILAVGRLVRQKDYPTLLSAIRLVNDKMPVNLVILGEGCLEKDLKKIVSNFKIESRVKFLGFQKNPYKFMKNADVFVLSSLSEGFGNVIVEAMACGTPVVSTNCRSGPDEIIENGKTGILVPVGDSKLMSEAIIRILRDKVLARKLSAEGRSSSERFSAIESVREYEKVFRKIIN